ncbi:MAG: SDR family NAD(P)-dependent oxidoreductase [Acidimicrobiales bacterium]|jgi:NAD(P)-dependent dehydrogenase (short-subunit alcohol dehydrogenase family)|nr:SDR family NAD(P)-dependent oxidoreductase [Acidimicrobiales bacterium]MDP6298120.1 SDR family NAD(P)-dependent oxidoreductase [Acidimicrobiales bacterium]HJM29358.1 SDR family NAD(P)-dependent oxidoreductase [Acidimicrobiales bacterium]HJM96850.1 SDR family NAD(P)-dependent oxidoreductase [Acidimicrobiales bacterium]
MGENTEISEFINLSGKRALVTGGLKGIGKSITSRLSECGAKVLVADSDPTVKQEETDEKVDFIQCDITDSSQLIEAVSKAAGNDGLDFLVNNAGIFPTTGPLEQATDEFVTRMLEVNVRAQFSASREASKQMNRNGAIVNISSIAALRGGANITAYSTSKAAIIGLTQSFAQELGPKGIRVNAIAPGIIDTPGVQEQLEPLKAGGLDISAAIAANPLRMSGNPDYIARATLFLVSGLAEFITGHLLVVDGGSTA